jgi:hypothetical protein
MGRARLIWFAREIQEGVGIPLVDDEDVHDARPEHAEDRRRLLRLAHDGHHGLDPAKVVDRQGDQAST